MDEIFMVRRDVARYKHGFPEAAPPLYAPPATEEGGRGGAGTATHHDPAADREQRVISARPAPLPVMPREAACRVTAPAPPERARPWEGAALGVLDFAVL